MAIAARADRRHYAYALLTEAEQRIVRAAARRAGQSVAGYVRQCINSALVDEGLELELLVERRQGRPVTSCGD